MHTCCDVTVVDISWGSLNSSALLMKCLVLFKTLQTAIYDSSMRAIKSQLFVFKVRCVANVCIGTVMHPWQVYDKTRKANILGLLTPVICIFLWFSLACCCESRAVKIQSSLLFNHISCPNLFHICRWFFFRRFYSFFPLFCNYPVFFLSSFVAR